MKVDEQLISVIIPVYQGERHIKGAIASVLNQTHSKTEVIVVDDGSTDGTWASVSSIDDARVRILHQENSGAAAARNLGLQTANGRYIAFLDADDRWLRGKLEAEFSALAERDNPVGIAYSWYYAIDEDGMLLHKSPALRYQGYVFDDLLKGSTFILPSASLFHSDIFKNLGGFNTERRHHEDFAFILRACRSYQAYPTAQYSVLYRQSMSGKGRGIMRDYNAALNAALSIGDDLHDLLMEAEADYLRKSQRKALYFRFLMYGFDASASRLLNDIPTNSLLGGVKGLLGWLFAKTRLNLMKPSREVVQHISRIFRRKAWHKFIAASGVSLIDRSVVREVVNDDI